MIGQLIQVAGTFAHLPVVGRIVPGFVRRWLCDRFDAVLGVKPTELRRT